MNKLSILIIASMQICLLFVFAGRGNAQSPVNSFHKGALLVSLSEGKTYTRYMTYNTNIVNDGGQATNINGDRDPLTLEYGLSNKWGIGINLGTDVIKIQPAELYNFEANNKVNALMSEFTIDAHYHFFSSPHVDLSAFFSLGLASVSFKGTNPFKIVDRMYPSTAQTEQLTQFFGDYKYNSVGGIVRVGGKAKYYFRKRFGVMAMVSTYFAKCSTKGVKDNTAGDGFATSIKGFAWEIGPCYRFF